MVKEPRRVPKPPGMSRGNRIFLVLIVWALIAAMAFGSLFPELNLPIGHAGGPPVVLVGIFLVVWIVALLQVSAKVGYFGAGLLLIVGPLAGPAVAMAASELYADAMFEPTTAVVVATHPRDRSPVPTEFRFGDGSTRRGIWQAAHCDQWGCSYEVLPPGTEVEVDRDPTGRFPPRGPVSDLTGGAATGWWALLAGAGGVVAAVSVSVIVRRRSLIRRSDEESEAERKAGEGRESPSS